MMIDAPVRQAHREELISNYFNKFAATLGKLGYQEREPTLLELNMELLKKGELGSLA